MERKRGESVPTGEVIADLPGLVAPALHRKPPTR